MNSQTTGLQIASLLFGAIALGHVVRLLKHAQVHCRQLHDSTLDQRTAGRDRGAPEFLDVEVVEIGFESAAARPFANCKPDLIRAGVVTGAA